jgi:dolichyl-phosphate beta-glucosyltransferase
MSFLVFVFINKNNTYTLLMLFKIRAIGSLLSIFAHFASDLIELIIMISFVLPVYNCYDKLILKLPELIRILQAANIRYEIIIVDDGSQLKEDVKRYLNQNCKLLVNQRNYGKGYSVTRGIVAASGDYIIFMDGDFPFDLEVIERLYNKIQQPDIDMIIGDRTMLGSSYTQASTLRYAGSKVISFIVSSFVTKGYYDTQCGLKGFKKKVAKDIFSRLTINGFSFDVEVIFIAIKRKYRIERIAVVVKKQLSSNVIIVLHGIEMVINFIRIEINYRLGKYN